MKGFVEEGHSLLLRAVRRLVVGEESGAVAIIIENIESRDWASATFVGQRHRLSARLEGEAAAVEAARARLAGQLADSGGAGRRHFIADAMLVAHGWTQAGAGRAVLAIEVEALTLESA